LLLPNWRILFLIQSSPKLNVSNQVKKMGYESLKAACQGVALLCAALGSACASRTPQSPNPSCASIRCDSDLVCIEVPENGLPTCVLPMSCGGFTGTLCGKGYRCVDDPRDGCSVETGGADCGGICAPLLGFGSYSTGAAAAGLGSRRRG